MMSIINFNHFLIVIKNLIIIIASLIIFKLIFFMIKQIYVNFYCRLGLNYFIHLLNIQIIITFNHLMHLKHYHYNFIQVKIILTLLYS